MRRFLPSLLALSLPVLAATQLTLPDGRQVVLEEDFTWHYLLTTQGKPGEAMTLSQQALATPALLRQASAQGVTVSLAQQQHADGRLRLTLRVHNQQAGSVVQVEGRVRFYSAQGKALTEAPLRFWQSIYQLPDTYLRQGDTQDFTTDWLDLPAGQDTPLLQLQIETVKRRS